MNKGVQEWRNLFENGIGSEFKFQELGHLCLSKSWLIQIETKNAIVFWNSILIMTINS